MAVVIEAKSESAFNNVSTANIVLPSGVVAGDVLLLCISLNAAAAGMSIDQSWSTLGHQAAGSNDEAVYYKLAGGSESAPTVTFGGAFYGAWSCYRLSGTDASKLSTALTTESVSTTLFTFPSVAITSNALVLRFATIDAASHTGVSVTPTGTLESGQSASGTVAHLVYSTTATPSSTGTDTLTMNAPDRGSARTVAIEEAAPSYTITSIDGDNDVQAGQANVDIVMTATTGVTSVTLGGETLTINGVT